MSLDERSMLTWIRSRVRMLKDWIADFVWVNLKVRTTRSWYVVLTKWCQSLSDPERLKICCDSDFCLSLRVQRPCDASYYLQSSLDAGVSLRKRIEMRLRLAFIRALLTAAKLSVWLVLVALCWYVDECLVVMCTMCRGTCERLLKIYVLMMYWMCEKGRGKVVLWMS